MGHPSSSASRSFGIGQGYDSRLQITGCSNSGRKRISGATWIHWIVTTQVRKLRKHVLVVEDSAVIRRLIEVCLRPMNLEVTLVPDGIDGLERAAGRPPDAVVLDIGLRGMDGWEVLASLRGATNTEDVPVLMLTSHGEAYGEYDAEIRGAAGLMTKPFLPAALREAVASLLMPHERW